MYWNSSVDSFGLNYPNLRREEPFNLRAAYYPRILDPSYNGELKKLLGNLTNDPKTLSPKKVNATSI